MLCSDGCCDGGGCGGCGGGWGVVVVAVVGTALVMMAVVIDKGALNGAFKKTRPLTPPF